MKTLLLALLLAAGSLQDKPQRALDLLDESGQQYEKSGSGWTVKFTGNNLKEVSIYVAQTDTVIVLGSLVALKSEVRDVTGLNDALLRANEEYDYVKIVIDSDGDYLVRLDLLAQGLTAKAFGDHLVQVATVTDLLKPTIDKFKKK